MLDTTCTPLRPEVSSRGRVFSRVNPPEFKGAGLGPGFLLAPDGTALLRDIIQPRIPSIDSRAISSLLVSIRRSASQSDETWIFPHSPVNGNTLFIFTLFIYLVQKNKILI